MDFYHFFYTAYNSFWHFYVYITFQRFVLGDYAFVYLSLTKEFVSIFVSIHFLFIKTARYLAPFTRTYVDFSFVTFV